MSTDIHWTELVAQARELAGHPEAPLPDDEHERENVRQSATLAACEAFYMNGVADEQLGRDDDFGHFYRVSRWTVETDERGFQAVTEHGSEREAREWWDTLEREYEAFMAAAEE